MSQVEMADSDLRTLVERARNGEEVTITEHGCVVARIVAVKPESREPRQLGLARGKWKIPEDFDAPLPDDVIDLFYDGSIFPDDDDLNSPKPN